jgi:WD40 repeat protein
LQASANVFTDIFLSGPYIFTSSEDTTAVQWEYSTATIVMVFRHTQTLISLVALEDDLYVGSWDRKIIQFKISSGEQLKIFTGHSDLVSKIIISGDFLFSASHDGSARLWSRVRAVEIKQFLSFDDRIVGVFCKAKWSFVLLGSLVNMVSLHSKKVMNILTLENQIFGGIFIDDTLIVAARNYTSVSVYRISSDNLSLYDLVQFPLPEMISAFFSDSLNSVFLFGTIIGQIFSFDVKFWTFQLEVSAPVF